MTSSSAASASATLAPVGQLQLDACRSPRARGAWRTGARARSSRRTYSGPPGRPSSHRSRRATCGPLWSRVRTIRMIAALAAAARGRRHVLARLSRRRRSPSAAGVNPRIVVTPNGTGPRRLVDPGPRCSRAPPSAIAGCLPGRRACDRRQVLLFPSEPAALRKSGGDVTVRRPATRALRITSACYGCAVGDAQEGIQRWDSYDSGSPFVPTRASAAHRRTPASVPTGSRSPRTST